MCEEAEKISEDVGVEEAARPKPLRSPGNPTKAEIEDHEVTHLRYRSWCSHCVRGTAVDDQHRTQPKEEDQAALPRISVYHSLFLEQPRSTEHAQQVQRG